MYYLFLDHVRDWTTNIMTYKILKYNDNLIHSILLKKKKNNFTITNESFGILLFIQNFGVFLEVKKLTFSF